MWQACNFAVIGMVVAAPVAYQYCMYQRQAEKEGMTRVMEIMNRKEMEKKAREQRKEKMREERRDAKDKEQDEKLKAMNGGGKPWWKVW